MPDTFKKKRNFRDLLKSPDCFEVLIDFQSNDNFNMSLDEETEENKHLKNRLGDGSL